MVPNWAAQLSRYAAPPPRPAQRCELCSTPLGTTHAHLVAAAERRMLCACRGCGLLFENRNDGRLRRVPERRPAALALTLSDDEWHALGVPIDVAFFYRSTLEGRVAGMYPGAGGVVAAVFDPAAWQTIAARNPFLASFEADVEALLVDRMNGAREYYRVPIDRCFALSGLIRRHWRGLSGGIEVWRRIDAFFVELRRG